MDNCKKTKGKNILAPKNIKAFVFFLVIIILLMLFFFVVKELWRAKSYDWTSQTVDSMWSKNGEIKDLGDIDYAVLSNEIKNIISEEEYKAKTSDEILNIYEKINSIVYKKDLHPWSKEAAGLKKGLGGYIYNNGKEYRITYNIMVRPTITLTPIIERWTIEIHEIINESNE